GVAVPGGQEVRGRAAGRTGDPVAVEDEDGDAGAWPEGSRRRLLRSVVGNCCRTCSLRLVREHEPAERREHECDCYEGREAPGERAAEGLGVLHGPSRFAL